MMHRKGCNVGFSLVEVVLAIGVIAFALIAIIGVLPVGLTASHSSQGETRATQIAQDIFAELEIQARPAASPASSLNNAAYVDQQATFPQATPNPPVFIKRINLTGDVQTWGADSDGNLQPSYNPSLPYQVTVTVTANPSSFTSGYASTVTIRVAWQPVAQNYREFTRIISRY